MLAPVAPGAHVPIRPLCSNMPGPLLPAPQSEAHEATKAQLAAAQEASAALRADLAALQAQHDGACAAKAELVKEKGQLEKRVSTLGGVPGKLWYAWQGLNQAATGLARLIPQCRAQLRRLPACYAAVLHPTWHLLPTIPLTAAGH